VTTFMMHVNSSARQNSKTYALYGSGDIGEFVNDLANSHPFVRQES